MGKRLSATCNKLPLQCNIRLVNDWKHFVMHHMIASVGRECGLVGEFMTAQILPLDRRRLRRRQAAGPGLPTAERAKRFQFWIGASGARYIHSVYSLFTCPEINDANYLICKTDPDTGASRVLKSGFVNEGAPSLNLARLRHWAASVGADEIHLHLLAGSAKRGKLIAYDIETALAGGAAVPSGAEH